MNLNVYEDIEAEPETIQTVATRLLHNFSLTIRTWNQQPTEKMRRALLVVALCVGGEMEWDHQNDALITQLVALIHGDKFRAHPDGAYAYSQGSFDRMEEFHEVYLRSFQDAVSRSKALFFASADYQHRA